VPTLVIIGDSDVVRPEHAVEIFRLLGGGVPGDIAGLPASRLAVLPGTTRVTLVDRTDWLLLMVTEFLDAPVPEAGGNRTEDDKPHQRRSTPVESHRGKKGLHPRPGEDGIGHLPGTREGEVFRRQKGARFTGGHLHVACPAGGRRSHRECGKEFFGRLDGEFRAGEGAGDLGTDLFFNVHCFASVISAIAPAAFASGQSLLCSAQQKQALFTAVSACSTFSSDTDFPV